MAGVGLRPLVTLEQADLITEVMIATWGEHQLLPREVLRALQESGNIPFGAFDGQDMVGYVLGFAGVDREGLHMHSHMLAVRPGLRHKGIGYALKLAQRAQALDQGITIVRWTFDPLVSRNAYFNMAKLGARCDRFGRSFYGEMTDALNRGERSDRLVVRWDLEREPTGPARSEGLEALGREGPKDLPKPAVRELPAGRPVLVRIPREYADLKERDAGLGEAWRDALADVLDACFEAGLVVTGFTTDSTYVLS